MNNNIDIRNRKRHAEYMRNYYHNNPEQKKKWIENAKQWKANNPEKMKEIRKRENDKNREIKSLWAFNKARKEKLRIIEVYGNICTCCGEDTIEFLSIDHINNDGAKHRKELKINGDRLYAWLIRNNYPKGFQVLCMNCNTAKGYYGKCPHQVIKEMEGF